MKKIQIKNFNFLWLMVPFLALSVLVGCSKDDDDDPDVADPVASFQYEIDANNFLAVSFTNFSQNATGYSWDFGDMNTSTEASPTHTYSAAGDYTVVLTASNDDGVTAQRSESISISDPDEALKLLAGESSKTWKLFREGTSMSNGPNSGNPAGNWPGLTNDGKRPCLYEQEITFGTDGSYTFDDNGMFWGEYGVWGGIPGVPNTSLLETCFDAVASNMINANGDDVSAWLSGTHQFEYDASTGELTLTGLGAWIGIPKLGTDGESVVPVSQVRTKISIEEFTGYDVMLVEFEYADSYWPIRYVNYSDPSLEPELETDAPTFGEDYDDISPAELSNSFSAADAFVLLDTISPTGSTVNYGVDDPADAMAAKVGQFNRTAAQFQELQMQTSPTKNDVNFENLTSVSLDVYIPSSNDYSGALTKAVIIGLADKGHTEQWWTDNMEYINDGTSIATDEWVTLTYQLDSPTYAAMGGTPFDRNDFDMVYINIGGGNHSDTGTFYVRNLIFQ